MLLRCHPSSYSSIGSPQHRATAWQSATTDLARKYFTKASPLQRPLHHDYHNSQRLSIISHQLNHCHVHVSGLRSHGLAVGRLSLLMFVLHSSVNISSLNLVPICLVVPCDSSPRKACSAVPILVALKHRPTHNSSPLYPPSLTGILSLA